MAEFAVATFILQVAGAGIKLCWALYDFGSTLTWTRGQTTFIAPNLTLYSHVLRTHGQLLKTGQAIYTEEALSLEWDLKDQIEQVFGKITNLCPERQNNYYTTISQLDAWEAPAAPVEFLVAQIDLLKTTVSPLLTVLFAKGILCSSPQVMHCSSFPGFGITKTWWATCRQDSQISQAMGGELKLDCMQVRKIVAERQAIVSKLRRLERAAQAEDRADASATSIMAGLEIDQQTLAMLDALTARIAYSTSWARLLQITNNWVDCLLERLTYLVDGVVTLPTLSKASDNETPSTEPDL